MNCWFVLPYLWHIDIISVTFSKAIDRLLKVWLAMFYETHNMDGV